MAASLLGLSPDLATNSRLDLMQVNAIFFVGSIPFTIAAYLQLFQAANAGGWVASDSRVSKRHTAPGWRPNDIGWLSSAFQFAGTVLFNFNTFDAMLPSLNWIQQDLVIWVPNIVGSILFLSSRLVTWRSSKCVTHTGPGNSRVFPGGLSLRIYLGASSLWSRLCLRLFCRAHSIHRTRRLTERGGFVGDARMIIWENESGSSKSSIRPLAVFHCDHPRSEK